MAYPQYAGKTCRCMLNKQSRIELVAITEVMSFKVDVLVLNCACVVVERTFSTQNLKLVYGPLFHELDTKYDRSVLMPFA